MDFNEITNLIGSLGFPIVMCLLMYKQSIRLTDSHKQEVDNLATIIQNNTTAIERLAILSERED